MSETQINRAQFCENGNMELSGRRLHPEDTIINVGGKKIGGAELCVIAGPCAIETREQICSIALAVKAAGASFLRGGAFKPRMSPYSFQGLEAEGIALLLEARRVSGLPVVSEITAISQLPLFEMVDIIQVGARNMQNYELLKELGKTQKPILLKRGLSATYEELLMSAEYIMAGGNSQVILCERGVRSFENYTRNILDLAAIPALRELSHLPIIVDPSHALGRASLVPSMCGAAVAAGADGLMIEVHDKPDEALCDGPQALKPEEFSALMKKLSQIKNAIR
ncbi:MAG: 3-deoxy-7-phosphoheptulonate synthase [Oscillospiraceae bacterium]